MTITISKRTLEIISNFSQINTGLLLEAHSQAARVMKETKSVIGVATIEEDIPNNVAIYNVSEFLRCVGLFKSPVFDFQAKHVVIAEETGANKLRYRYSDASLITAMPKKDIKMPDGVADVTITTDQLDRLNKAANTLGLNDVILRGSPEGLYLEATNLDDKESNNFKVMLDTDYDGAEFEAHFLLSNLNFITGSYEVTVHQAITRWVKTAPEGSTDELTYYVAIEKSSKF